jgi:hypothetical protein
MLLEKAIEELNGDGYRVLSATNIGAPAVNPTVVIGERVPLEGAKSIVPQVRYITDEDDDTSTEGSLRTIAKYLKQIALELKQPNR